MFTYLAFLLVTLALAQGRINKPENKIYKLCTYTGVAQNKCLYTVEAAQRNSLNLPLACVQETTRQNCLNSVQNGDSDLVTLGEDDYHKARQQGLKPSIFTRQANNSVYIAVAPKTMTLIELTTAGLEVDMTNERAQHAATFFNHQRGIEICPTLRYTNDDKVIKIIDSAVYKPNPAEEILICGDGTFADVSAYQDCNIEASLQDAVFVRAQTRRYEVKAIKQKIFDPILLHFGTNGNNGNNGTNGGKNDGGFNFFSTYDGVDDVIFKNNTNAFDLTPTYHNYITERAFFHLHCNDTGHEHFANE